MSEGDTKPIKAGQLKVGNHLIYDGDVYVVKSVEKSKAKSIDIGEVGLPKPEVDEIEVTTNGPVGDYNHYRVTAKKNTPSRALLIMTTDKIDELNEEGWPIQYGDMGENITVSGLNYDQLGPNTKLQVGNVHMEITEACNPCANLFTLSYISKEKEAEFLKTLKGRRGWYAKVHHTGRIKKNDKIEIV